jgi:flagellin-like hook-associated protein FlgL
MSQISLTASMRSNLLSLQNTASLMSQTQERLASGNKVNSAIDNPSSYYTAQSLNNRANDLNNLLDSMGQAISTIKAANEGIESITTFVEQAKAVANSALDSSDAATRTKYANQFKEIINQISAMASDSGYKGVNLLTGDGTSVSLTVVFNEKTTGQNKLEIKGQSATATGLGLVGSTAGLVSAEGTGGTVDWSTDAKIKVAITATSAAINTLRDMASEFGNNYSIVKTREDFTTNLINVLQEGADKLTLADMNEESANMLALQTRQQLAINSLSLASQASQSVLKLF